VPDGASIQELITRAGGLTQFADIKRIRLIRKEAADGLRPEENIGEEEKAKERVIDFSLFKDKTELNSNPILKANDVMVIPRIPDVKPVHILGAVQNPGVFTLEKPSPLIEALSLAGGLSDAADLKKISILSFSDDKYSMRTVDFERFLTGEDLTANPQVSPSEVIFVPKLNLEEKRIWVNVVGQVTNPGGYKIAEGERLFDAIFMAGGFAADAAIDKVTITHPQLMSPIKIKTEVNLENFLTTGDLKDNPQLAESDIVFVPMSGGAKKVIPPLQSPFFPNISINVFGEVANPNTYQVSSDSNLLDILRLAGGPTGDADLKRVMIIREKAEKEQRLLVDLEKVLQEGELKLLLPLLTEDTIFVPKIKPRRNIWGAIVKTAADVSTIAIAVLIVTGKRYYR
jgi:protein involved in polysaccharide export with SLBB domain